MTKIDYYFSVLSPFAYLAGDRLEAIARKHNATVNYKPMDIIDLFGRTGGVPPKDRHPSRRLYRQQELSRIAQMNGMPINLNPAHWPTDPVPASAAIIRASLADESMAGALSGYILSCIWHGERDIAEASVINECITAAGGRFSAEDVVNDESLRQVYAKNTDDAERSNVFGSPSYVVEDQVFWGQDRLAHLDAWLDGKIK